MEKERPETSFDRDLKEWLKDPEFAEEFEKAKKEIAEFEQQHGH